MGENHAPELDAIAWYGGNSGVDYDLDEAGDASGWPKKQHDFTRAGTRRVGLKQPNPWGLYNMLGNVYEWCQDRHAPYTAAHEVDPRGPEQGTHRVVRGGSWNGFARRCRAAARDALDPSDAGGYLGFRLARGQAAPSQPPERGRSPQQGR